MNEKEIQSQLDTFEGGLFLDKYWDNGQIVYTVSHIIERGSAPYVAVEWRGPDGRPLGLDESVNGLNIIETLRSQEGSVRDAMNQAIVENAVAREKRKEELEEYIDEELRWIEKSSKKLHISGPWDPKHDVI